jgi:ferric-dicitrate binding protein FerR (iron transport regulator)
MTSNVVVLRSREVADDRRRKLENCRASDRAHSAYVRNRWDGSSQSDLSAPEVGLHLRKRLASLIGVSRIALALWAAIWMAVGLLVSAV